MNDLRRELRFAAVCTLVLDVVLWLVSLPLCGAGIPVPLGLVLGSAGMYCNLLLLRRSILNAVHHGKTRDFVGYLLRCAVASAIMAAGLLAECVSAVAAVLPFLYPKIIFGILAMQDPKKKNGKNGGM